MLLEGKVALVTGAARNVGRGVALRFAREGAEVVVNDIDADALEKFVGEAKAEGLRVFPVVCDISDADAVGAMIEKEAAARGRLDVLVNNAIIHTKERLERGPFLKVPGEAWREFTRRNLDALFFATQTAALVMAKARSGSIINISSNGAIAAHRRSIAYDAVKGAVESFTRAVAVDLAPWGVRVNALRPIAVRDEPVSAADEAWQKRLGEMVPMGRIARPADVAWACCYLASDDAAFVTGQVWNIDGGMLEQSRPPQLELEPVTRPEDLDL